MSIISSVLKVIVGLAMVLVVIAVALFIFTSFHISIGGPSASTGAKVLFTIEPNQTVTTVAENLQNEGIIDSTFWFRTRLKLKGAESDLKAGRFQLSKGMDTDKLIDTLTTSPAEIGLRFQVIEGMRVGEIADKLASEGIVATDTFKSLAGTAEGAATFQDDFLQASGKPADQGLEGYLFPDTYEIKQVEGDNSEAVIRKMLTTLEEKITPEMRQQIAARNQSIYTCLAVASIVQREGKVKAELPVIAAVFWNRLNRGMKLDADPTTQYAVGKSGDWWPNLDKLGILPKDLQHPYNTYTIPALPPGPICNPGLDAIQAAITPDQNDYLYFVAKKAGDGSHVFAKTFEEHQRNVVENSP